MIRRYSLGFLFASLALLWLAGCGKTGGKDNPDGGPDTDTSESCAESNPCGEHGTCDDTSGVVQCDCEDGWGGDFCDECAPGWHADGAECVLDETCLPNSCAGHGTCDDSTGIVICDCDTGYTGDFCDACDADYHLNNEGNCDADETCETASCNSHGTCDDTTGVVVCDCEVGWEGPYCIDCAPGFHPASEAADGGVDAGADGGAGDDACVLDETCMPTSCDGHGTCEDETGEVICDCDANYTGQFCTDCDEGFHWESNTCVTDTDCPSPTEACSGHGTCDDSTGVPVCTCLAAYDGSDICDACAPGYHDDDISVDVLDCVPDTTCLDETCDGHGTCDDSGDIVVCACDPGYLPPFCHSCDDGHHMVVDTCVDNTTCIISLDPDVDSCHTHGTCDDLLGVAICTCDPGWTGSSCSTCVAGYHDDAGACVLDETCLPGSCAYNGTCDDTGGIVVCTCNPGYDVLTYCAECAVGYHYDVDLDGCIADETCPTTGECSGHGTCDDTTGEAICACDDGYDGDTCNLCAAGYHGSAGDCVLDESCLAGSCSYHGTCDDTGGIVVCTCDPGYDVAAYCADCATGYHWLGGACVADETCPMTGECSGHGTCDDTTGEAICTCDDGWTGDACSTCAAGYHDDAGACVLDETCLPGSCAYNGTCDDTGGIVVCTCNPGYDLATYCAECAVDFHYVVATDTCVADTACAAGTCNLNGDCDDTTGEPVCTCYDGWDGDFCNSCAPGYHSDAGDCLLDEQCMPNSCSGVAHGACDDSSGEVVCSCIAASGYTGTYCDQCLTGFHAVGTDCVADEVCDAEPHTTTCNGNGDCAVVGGIVECTCDYGWDGDTCNTCDPGFHVDGLNCVLDESCLAGEASCSYRGTCTVSSGHVACSCDDPNMNDAAYCASCNAGYHLVGSACVADEVCDAEPHTTTCSGNGDCSVVGGEVVCACDVGWDGDACDTCAPGFEPDGFGGCVLAESCLAGEASCAYHGTCADTTGHVVCTCDLGYDSLDYCADCAFGYHWLGGACVVDEDCLPSPCGVNGDCSVVGGEEVCSCDAGYSGDTCAVCAPGFQDNDLNGTCLIDCDLGTVTCDHGGTCSDNPGAAHCDCASGWSGTECGTCVDDSYENDDSDAFAHHTTGDLSRTGLVICGTDEDWYSVSLPEGGSVSVTVNFTHSTTGDIDIYLWYPSEDAAGVNKVAASESSDDNESFLYSVPTGEAGTYYIQIKGFGSFERNTYDLIIDREGTCDTCVTLGKECGTWNNGCGDITCGPCATGIDCDDYNGVCIETVCDIVGNAGCCDSSTNTNYYCDLDGVTTAEYPCGDTGEEYCAWGTDYGSGYFACYPDIEAPPTGMMQECPAYTIP